jgi:predicted transcriptional regulator
LGVNFVKWMSIMRPPKINDRKLLRLIDKEKMTQTKAAKVLGVSRQAVSNRLKEIRGQSTKVLVSKKVEQVVDKKLDAMEQLGKINEYANELLDLLMKWNRGDDEALQVLESQVRTVKVGKGEDAEEVKQYKFKDPRELALKAMAEIRGQLKLQLEIFQALFSLQAAEEFQTTVLEVISEVDPKVRNEIIRRINEKRAVRSAVHFS